MNRGKATCAILKQIRRDIAEKNDIALTISECTYQGNCSGTCPKCEAEVRLLEKALAEKKRRGIQTAVAGISAGLLAASLVSCTPVGAEDNHQDPGGSFTEQIETAASENTEGRTEIEAQPTAGEIAIEPGTEEEPDERLIEGKLVAPDFEPEEETEFGGVLPADPDPEWEYELEGDVPPPDTFPEDGEACGDEEEFPPLAGIMAPTDWDIAGENADPSSADAEAEGANP